MALKKKHRFGSHCSIEREIFEPLVVVQISHFTYLFIFFGRLRLITHSSHIFFSTTANVFGMWNETISFVNAICIFLEFVVNFSQRLRRTPPRLIDFPFFKSGLFCLWTDGWWLIMMFCLAATWQDRHRAHMHIEIGYYHGWETAERPTMKKKMSKFWHFAYISISMFSLAATIDFMISLQTVKLPHLNCGYRHSVISLHRYSFIIVSFTETLPQATCPSTMSLFSQTLAATKQHRNTSKKKNIKLVSSTTRQNTVKKCA